MNYKRSVFNNKGWKQYFKEDNINFSQTLNYSPNKFILSEFFNSPEAIMDKFIVEYEKKFGSNSSKYFLKSVPKWKSKSKVITYGMRNRIISLMPQLFNDSQKFNLIKFSIYEQISSLGKELKNKFVNEQNLNSIYLGIINNIEGAESKIKLLPLLSNLKLNNQEKDTVEKIIKYVLIEQLIFSYNGMSDDIKMIKNELSNVISGIKNVEYNIELLDCKFKITSNPIESESELKNSITLNQSKLFEKDVRHFLVNESFKLESKKKKGTFNGEISKKDISMLVKNQNDLLTKGIQSRTTSLLNGKVGFLTIEMESKSKDTIFFELIKNLIYLILLLIPLSFSVYLFLNGSIILSILIGFIVIGAGANFWEKNVDLYKEYKDYGKW